MTERRGRKFAGRTEGDSRLFSLGEKPAGVRSVPGLVAKLGLSRSPRLLSLALKVEGRDWALHRERVLLADTVYQVSHITLQVPFNV